MENNLLSKLRDIHLPDSVSVFPLAIGWYILIVIFIVIVFLFFFKLFQLKIKNYKINKIFLIIEQIENTKEKSDDFIADITILLKRVAKLKYSKENPQFLYGVEFLKFLDRKMNCNDFTQGAGKVLLNIYQKNDGSDYSDLVLLVKKWIRNTL